MEKIKGTSKSFKSGLEKLGFEGDNALYFTDNTKKLPELEITFHIETAKFIHKEITAIFLRKQLNGSYKPQVYLFDFTDRAFSEQIENEIADIQRKIWSSGEVPLACFFFNTEIKIIDCTKHLTKDLKPEYLTDKLRLVDEAHRLYNEQFAVKIKSGIFWEQEEIKGKFDFKNSAYDTLIHNIRKVTEKLSKELKKAPRELINKIIVQSILIKYLEETSDDEGKKLLTEKYFKKYNNSNSFSDVLKKGKFSNLLNDLNKNFNGNVFKWETTEQEQLESLDLSVVAKLLATDKTSIDALQLEIGFPDWRYFEFKYIPVELISRLYEEFLGENKKDKGLFYTPSHLAKLLMDECLPLKKYKDIRLEDFTILDPACGSGIFLVTAFKRLVQIWRLQNKLNKPKVDDLKNILRNIYGVDKEEQAVMLSSFSLSLALCNELKPIEVINKLKFDDLTKENLVHSDFFVLKSIQNKKFDLIVGNPPFVRGKLPKDLNYWENENGKIKIPQSQIALKFLTESFPILKENGLVCLIIKASGLLYNSTSFAFKKVLFSNYNVVQLLDFTALARNKSLWDNGADVATAAIFVRNNKPDVSKNILHLTFRRTKATKDRIVFEIDDYDLHFVNRQTAISNEFIWKNNLLGGGRIKNLVEKFQQFPLLKDVLKSNDCISGEGFIVGTNGTINKDFIYKYPTLPTKGISAKGINYNSLRKLEVQTNFVQISNEALFKAPNIILWENIGVDKLPVFYNEIPFTFKDKIVSIATEKQDKSILKEISDSFNKYSHFYRFYIFVTSSQVLVNLNTAILKKDYMSLKFILNDNSFTDFISSFDKKIVSDVNVYFQDFLRHGEKSKALQNIKFNKLEPVLLNYGIEFSRALNSVYENKGKRFRLSDVVQLDGTSLIATVFRYDNKDKEPLFHKNFTKLNIDGLANNEISAHLSVKRIIKLYPQKDTIVFIKPNQYRYWLSLIAYRDADKCFSDFSNQIEE
jgi:methylase of polypeptide subunit release factors